jgi:hypothetical protein
METAGRPDCGVCAAVDVHYPSTGGARAAAVLAADAAFAHTGMVLRGDSRAAITSGIRVSLGTAARCHY